MCTDKRVIAGEKILKCIYSCETLQQLDLCMNLIRNYKYIYGWDDMISKISDIYIKIYKKIYELS